MTSSSGSYFLGMDEDEDREEEDENDELVSSYSGAKYCFTGLKLNPWDPNPLIKPCLAASLRRMKKSSQTTS
jgi:hypothetical protein